MEIINTRYFKLINYFPFLFLFIGVLHGFNLHIYTFFIVLLGVMSLFFLNLHKKNYLWVLILFSLNWIINSRKYNFTLELDKIVGFSSSSFNSSSVTYWSIIFALLIFGVYALIRKSIDQLDYEKIKNNFYFPLHSLFYLDY